LILFFRKDQLLCLGNISESTEEYENVYLWYFDLEIIN